MLHQRQGLESQGPWALTAEARQGPGAGEGRLRLTEQAARWKWSEGSALFLQDRKEDIECAWKYRDDLATWIEFGAN